MKTLKCFDVSHESCGYEAHAENIDDVKYLLRRHEMSAHSQAISSLSDSQLSDMESSMDRYLISH